MTTYRVKVEYPSGYVGEYAVEADSAEEAIRDIRRILERDQNGKEPKITISEE